MVVTTQKLLWVTFVIVLAFPTEGRMLSTDQETNLVHVENGKRVHFQRLRFGMLPRNIPAPPSGPSRGHYAFGRINFEMLPGNIHVPPSGPSTDP